MLDALVIGAGPSGSRTAWNLAKAGYSITLVEEHEIVGDPCQCAGLITPRTFEYLGYKRPVSQEMNGARLWGPKDSFLNFQACLLYTSPSPRDRQKSRMPSSA